MDCRDIMHAVELRQTIMDPLRSALVSVLLTILTKGSLTKPLSVEARLTLKPQYTREGEGDVYRIQVTQDRRDVTVTQIGTSKRVALEEICPQDSDCERFLFSIKFFLLELGGTFAGLSWGAWSTLFFAINQVNSEQ